MRKVFAIVVVFALMAAMVVPTAAFAGGGNGKGGAKSAAAAKKSNDAPGKPAAKAKKPAAKAGKPAAKVDKPAVKAAAKQAKQAAKAEKAAAKQTSKAAKVQAKSARRGGAGVISENASETPEPSADVDEADTPDASEEAVKATGIANAFQRIQRNLERKIARASTEAQDGVEGQLPPGLRNVWLKFAGWLGIDVSLDDLISGGDETSDMGDDSSALPENVPPSTDDSGTVGPSDEPSGTVDPGEEPSETVVPEATP